MPDDAISSPTTSLARPRPRRRRRRLRRRRRAGPDGATGRSGSVRPRRDASGRRRAASRRRSPSASAGSTPRTTSPTRSRPSRASATGSATRASRPRSSAGMGGSSLAPDVLHRTFGTPRATSTCASSTRPTRRPWPRRVDDLDPLATLWIVASKSGTTTEPLAFLADAWARAERALGGHHAPRNEHAGELIVAITDPGRSVEAIPHHDELREVFLNPPDIGGRYSRADVRRPRAGLAHRARPRRAPRRRRSAMLGACREPDPGGQPGRQPRARDRDAGQGRPRQADVPRRPGDRRASGRGLEQLIAESTGKHGIGIVPVDREPLGGVERLRRRSRVRPARARPARRTPPATTLAGRRSRPPATR